MQFTELLLYCNTINYWWIFLFDEIGELKKFTKISSHQMQKKIET